MSSDSGLPEGEDLPSGLGPDEPEFGCDRVARRPEPGLAPDESAPADAPAAAGPHPSASQAPPGMAGGSPPQVLAQGYLHPGILFLRLANALRSSVIPILFALFLMDGGWRIGVIAMSVSMLVLNMAYALIRFVTFRYWLTTEELITTEGVFNRQERRIPVNRVQDLSFEQTLIRRFFGLVVVTVETASGEGAEARLDSLGLRPAAQLREAMQYIRSQRGAGAAAVADASAHESGQGREALPQAPPERQLFRVRAWDLTVRGLTDNRAGAILIGIFVLADQLEQFKAFGLVADFVNGAMERLAAMDLATAVLVSVVAAVVVVLLGWVVSIAASFLLFHDFHLVQRGEVFQRRYGLLTTRVRSLPKQKIQRVLMEQNLLRRVFRFVVVRADSAGSGTNQKEELKSGLDVVAPMTKLRTGRMLVPHLLPGMVVEGLPWNRVSSKVVTRLLAEGAVSGVLAAGVAVPFIGLYGLLALLYPLVALASGILIYHNLGYAHAFGHFAMRWGILGRYRAFIPLHKVQAVVLRAGPWDRAFGLARLVVYVAGAAPTTLQHLTRADAQRLQQELARTAAHSKFVW